MFAQFTPDQNLKLILFAIVTAGVVLICLFFSFVAMRLGMTAFGGSRPEAPQVFGLFFEELPRITTIVFIVVSVVGLTATEVIDKGACMTLLGSIAGYILGGQRRSRKKKTDG
jgi:hypothetical protein